MPLPSCALDLCVDTSAYARVVSTARQIRSQLTVELEPRNHHGRSAALLRAVGVGLLTLTALAVTSPPVTPRFKAANSGLDSELFSLTNQDRASNGVGALAQSGTLAGIGEAHPYSICGRTAAGRAQDMMTYNGGYFAHPIPPCGVYVFVMMQEAGVAYRSAGENIGWDANASDPASYINTEFMNSPDHRSNILNGNYTQLGIGSASSSSWMGQSNVWMFAQEFAQVGSSAPPPAPRPAPVQPAPKRNTTVPTTSLPAPAATAVPLTVPVPPPTPTVAPGPPTPTSGLQVTPPLIWSSSGLLSDSVESVLEGYLVN